MGRVLEPRTSHNWNRRSPRELFAPETCHKMQERNLSQPPLLSSSCWRFGVVRVPWGVVLAALGQEVHHITLLLYENVNTSKNHNRTPKYDWLQVPTYTSHLKDKVEIASRWACIVSSRPLNSHLTKLSKGLECNIFSRSVERNEEVTKSQQLPLLIVHMTTNNLD